MKKSRESSHYFSRQYPRRRQIRLPAKAADFRDYDDAARVVQMGTYNGRCSMFRPWPAQTTFTAAAKSSLRRRNIKGSVLIRTDSGFLDTKRKKSSKS